MNTNNKQSSWEKVKQEVRQFKDALGMPVDEGIFETVAVFRYLGINTTMSCAGHLDRITRGPYVYFMSNQNGKLLLKMKEIGDRTNPEYKQLFNETTRNNLIERQKIIPSLDAFYTNRFVSYNQRIIIEGFGPSKNYMLCQGAELAYILDQKEQVDLLGKNQTEMKTFTQYLIKQLQLI